MHVIDAGNQHRIHLHQNAPRREHFQPLLLLPNQNGSRRLAPNAAILPKNPRINLRADFRVKAVDGDRHMVDVVPCDFICVLRQIQPVGGYAQLDIRRFCRELAESLKSAFRVGERVARPRDAQHRHLRNGRRHRQHLFNRLIRH